MENWRHVPGIRLFYLRWTHIAVLRMLPPSLGLVSDAQLPHFPPLSLLLASVSWMVPLGCRSLFGVLLAAGFALFPPAAGSAPFPPAAGPASFPPHSVLLAFASWTVPFGCRSFPGGVYVAGLGTFSP